MIKVNEELRSAAVEYMEENRLSKAAIAEQLGIHRTSVSQYFGGKEEELSPVTVEKIETALLKLIEPPTSEKPAEKKPRRGTALCETSDSLGVMAVCQSCQDYMGLGIIAGRSGFGKTFTLKFYAKSPKVCTVLSSSEA